MIERREVLGKIKGTSKALAKKHRANTMPKQAASKKDDVRWKLLYTDRFIEADLDPQIMQR